MSEKISDNKPSLIHSFENGQLGYMSISMQKFLNYDNESICYTSSSDYN